MKALYSQKGYKTHIFHLWFPRLSSSFNFTHHSQVLLLIFYFLKWQVPGMVHGKWSLCQAEISSDALSQLKSNVNGLSVNPPKPSMPERMMPTTQGWAEHLKPREIRADFQVFIIKQLPYWLCWKGSVSITGRHRSDFCSYEDSYGCMSVCVQVCVTALRQFMSTGN